MKRLFLFFLASCILLTWCSQENKSDYQNMNEYLEFENEVKKIWKSKISDSCKSEIEMYLLQNQLCYNHMLDRHSDLIKVLGFNYEDIIDCMPAYDLFSDDSKCQPAKKENIRPLKNFAMDIRYMCKKQIYNNKPEWMPSCDIDYKL